LLLPWDENDLRNPQSAREGTPLQDVAPYAQFSPERFQPHPTVPGREALELGQSFAQQRPRAFAVAPPEVMKRRGNLRYSLQEHFVRFGRAQPNHFPAFVSRKESSRVETGDAFSK
jgi:hypothetical protein